MDMKNLFKKKSKEITRKHVRKYGKAMPDPAHGIGYVYGDYVYIPCCNIFMKGDAVLP